MTETNEHAWPDRPLTDAQERNRASAELIPVSRSGVIPMNFAQMVDYAKFMSTAKGAVGAHLMGNVGACLAVMEIANQYGMPAYAVARQSYLVNNRVAFMGQFFHSLIEDYAPLEKGRNGRKLQFRYEGENDTLKIIVSATFKGALDPVEYESPEIGKIPVKNSPLWKSEPKRQLQYFGVRGWQTINWPEGTLHAISDDEAAALPPSEYARDITPLGERPDDASAALRERLAAQRAAHGDKPREGFTEGFTEAHFTEVSPETPTDQPPEQQKPTEPEQKQKRARKAKNEDKTPDAMLPTTAAEWVPYASAIVGAATDAPALRSWWEGEMKLRNSIGVTGDERDPVFEAYQNRLAELEGD